MLLTILTRMSNDEQRLQLLQTLRYKLSYYNLNWLDIKNIINLFSKKDYIRFDILKFLLTYINNLINKISIDDFIYLSNQCTNNNEQIKFYLFELLYKKLNIDNNNDIQRIINLFQTINIRQKIETNIQSNLIIKNKFEVDDQHLSSHKMISYSEQTIVNNILSPTLSFVQELFHAPLKRTYSYDNKYQNYYCHQIITPLLIKQQDEFVQEQDLLSSNSSLSSISNENIPIRTRSFMIAIKNTFERLKETSS